MFLFSEKQDHVQGIELVIIQTWTQEVQESKEAGFEI